MTEQQLKDSGIVTAISVIGLVFGLIGMLGSFIPCLGVFATLVAIPATIISAVALIIAYSQKAKKTLAIVALTISCIGAVISLLQVGALNSVDKSMREDAKQRIATREAAVQK